MRLSTYVFFHGCQAIPHSGVSHVNKYYFLRSRLDAKWDYSESGIKVRETIDNISSSPSPRLSPEILQPSAFRSCSRLKTLQYFITTASHCPTWLSQTDMIIIAHSFRSKIHFSINVPWQVLGKTPVEKAASRRDQLL